MTTVIVGAGQAGSSLSAKLRALGHAGRIVLVGDEPLLPYQRPPLSKKYLLGEMPIDRLYLRPERFYADNAIELVTGRAVTAIDRTLKIVRLGTEGIPYEQLAFTTGSRPRSLPEEIGGGLSRVHVVRNIADVDRMAPEFREGRRVLIVGGGYIGLEAAAVAAKLGLSITLIEAAPRILQRVAAAETSDYFRALHGGKGVEILEATGLQRLEDGEAITAVLADGTTREVDFVIAGIGIVPNDDVAARAGLPCHHGIMVDRHGRTADPAIWAAGDCARFPFRGSYRTLESVQNAIDQAEAVAANILGAGEEYEPKPWFWSDQYDIKLQIAGLNEGYDRVVIRADAGTGATSHWYYRGPLLLAIDAVNDPRAYMVGKRLIEAGKSPDPAHVADPQTELKSLL